jgi:hypothetical protein
MERSCILDIFHAWKDTFDVFHVLKIRFSRSYCSRSCEHRKNESSE